MQTHVISTRSGWERLKAHLFAFMVSKLASNHGKRVLYITSLYCHVVRFERMQKDAIAKLNRVMQVAHRERAMDLPVAMRQYVWQDTSIDDLLNEDLLSGTLTATKARDLSAKVVDLAPAWLRYGPRERMVQETFELLSKGGQLAAA